MAARRPALCCVVLNDFETLNHRHRILPAIRAQVVENLLAFNVGNVPEYGPHELSRRLLAFVNVHVIVGQGRERGQHGLDRAMFSGSLYALQKPVTHR